MLKLKVNGKSAQLEASQPDEALLDALERAKLRFPYGCRSGTCGACRATVIKGMELLEGKTPIEEDTLANTQDPPDVRLACRARLKPGASGDIEIVEAPEVGALEPMQ